MQDSEEYKAKKAFFNRLLTIYGRNPVLEALEDKSLEIYRIHLAESNKPAKIINDIIQLAEQRNIEVCYHDKKQLSRISKNAKQDQGVAADITLKKLYSLDEFLQQHSSKQNSSNLQSKPFKLLALDNITNPQNLGMIIRSACAGYVDAIIIPNNGCASLNSLVIKASAGTLFKAPIIRCDNLHTTLAELQKHNTEVCVLSLDTKQSIFDYQSQQSKVFVLGNETHGVDKSIINMADQSLIIPMNNQVESLNVAVTAALIAFLSH